MQEMTDTSRIKTALQFLKDNQGFNVGGLWLSCKDKLIRVNGFTNYSSTEFMTKQIALEELQTVKDLFNEFKSSLKEFADFVIDKQVLYSLLLSDGRASFGICEELDDNVKWIVELNEK